MNKNQLNEHHPAGEMRLLTQSPEIDAIVSSVCEEMGGCSSHLLVEVGRVSRILTGESGATH